MDSAIAIKLFVVIAGVITAVAGIRLVELALNRVNRRTGGWLSLLKRELQRVLIEEPGVAVARGWSRAVAVAVLLTFGLIAIVVVPFHSGDASAGGGVTLLLVLCCLSVRIVVLSLQPVETEELRSTLGQVRWRTLLLLAMGMSSFSVMLSVGARESGGGVWGGLLQPLGFVLFATAAILNCLPVHGRFVPRVIDDMTMIGVGLLFVKVYLGGWHLWGADSPSALLQCIVILGKTGVVLGGMVWMRRRLEGCRLDAIEENAWRWLIPLCGLNVMVSGVVEFGVPAGDGGSRALLGWIAAAGVAVYLLSFHRNKLTQMADGLSGAGPMQ